MGHSLIDCLMLENRVATHFYSDSIVVNENCVVSVIAVLTQTDSDAWYKRALKKANFFADRRNEHSGYKKHCGTSEVMPRYLKNYLPG